MTAPSCFALPLLIQTLGLEQAALSLYFVGLLFGQFPFIISYPIFHKICVSVQ